MITMNYTVPKYLLVYRMSLAFRGVLRTAARRFQARTYADAPKGDEMAFTFAAGNKVNFLAYNFLWQKCNRLVLSSLCLKNY